MLRKVIASVVFFMALCTIAPLAHAADDSIPPATQAAGAWLKLVDQGSYAQSWKDASSLFKGHVEETEWETAAAKARGPLGSVISRKVKRARYETSLPGAPDGQYVVIQYQSSFEHKKSAVETVTPMLDTDGHWHVSGYYIR